MLTPSRNCTHMLFVDDSPTQRALWMYALSERGAVVRHEANLAGDCAGAQEKIVEIFVATNGAKALEILRARPIDLLITDLDMPDIDGWSVAREGLALQRNLKIFVVSANVVTGDAPALGLPASRVKLFSKTDRKLAMTAAANFTGGTLRAPAAPEPRLAYA